MEKRGQFFLLATIILVTVIAGVSSVYNYAAQKSQQKFYYFGDELEVESEKVIDYVNNNELNFKDVMTDFTQDYTDYSDADNFYFLFGDTNSIRFAGYKRIEDGTVTVKQVVEGDTEIYLTKETYKTQDFTPFVTNPTVKLVIEEITYSLELQTGQNFYYIVSKEIDGEKHVATNS
ncbi:MAG: hypothetical protein ABIH49_00080 [archaeon]